MKLCTRQELRDEYDSPSISVDTRGIVGPGIRTLLAVPAEMCLAKASAPTVEAIIEHAAFFGVSTVFVRGELNKHTHEAIEARWRNLARLP